MWRTFVPTPRTRVSVRTALPLLLFLLLFAALCVYLELSGTVLFANRTAFAFLLVTPWIWWMYAAGYSGLSRLRALAALLVRLTLVGLFTLLMAEPRAVRTRDVLSVVYALDISDSIGERSTDSALQFIARTVAEKPEQDEAGLVVFGRNAAVELPPRMAFPLEALNSRIDRDSTNLANSLSLAAAMLPEENQGRIVLVSDGIETEGQLGPVLDDLKSRQIAVDVLPIQYDYEHEVWLERLELPQLVKVGENYEAAVILSSLQAGSGNLVLRENGEVIFQENVTFQPGKNRYVMPIYLRQAGYYEYTAAIEVGRGRDQLRNNNTVLNYIFVAGEGKVLLVTDPQGDQRDWQTLAQIIREGRRALEVRTAYHFPRNSLSLMPYDCIVLVNVAADAFDVVQLKSIHDAVYDLGIGLLMVGGANSFGPGGYHRTLVEKALPISMDITQKKVLPKGALVIILHTCEFPEGNTWGKRVTKQAIKVLGSQDEVGVLAYESTGEGWVFPLTPAGDYDQLVPKINAAQIGDMPSFATTMRMGLQGLKESDAATKHMIIISDGDPSPPPPELMSEFVASKVSISTVVIFPHGQQAGQDIPKMRAIAAVTGGRFYFPGDPAELPSIFIKESKTLRRSMIQNKTVSPRVGFPSPILKGIGTLPPLHGYVLTSAKPRAATVLQVASGDADEADIDPILAVWRYGLGTTAAFTSDLSPNWGADWMSWDQRQNLIDQLVANISRVRQETHLKMWCYVGGHQGVIVVEDFHPQSSFLEMQARISGPRDRSETVELQQVGPRRYQANVPLWGKGRYQVIVAGAAGERTERIHGGLILPYSPEYLRFRSDPIRLREIADKTDGQQLTATSSADVIYGRRQPKRSSRRIFDWFLLGLVCLIPLDVGIRRVQIDVSLIKGWFALGRRRDQPNEMMDVLLRRKQAVDSQLDTQRETRPSEAKRTEALAPHRDMRPDVTLPSDSTRTEDKAADKMSSEGAPSADDQVKRSTTERLLDLKRRREHGDE